MERIIGSPLCHVAHKTVYLCKLKLAMLASASNAAHTCMKV